MASKASRQTSPGGGRVSRGGRSPSRPRPRPALARSAFPIAVVGASAGGLEALRRLLGALPAASGMSFILVPHLDPTRESRMVELLASSSSMPVTAAADAVRIRPDHVYVIPPNRLLTVRRGRLVLRPLADANAARTALDVALKSLAKDQGARAIGIVLSGTGSYGAEGLGEIIRAGGLGLAQDPATAQYDQMPRGAVAAGVPLRHVLPPESMAAVLLAHAQKSARTRSGRRASPSRSTGFFDGAGALDALAAGALPDLVERATSENSVRVWVPHCGAGAEAYSVAMLLLERLHAAGKGNVLKLFATDTDAEALSVARLGIYPASIADTVSRERLARFFQPVPTGQYQVASELRQAVVFGRTNLLIDPPISKLDLLVCRTQLGNLQHEERAALISRLHFALKPGGYLLLWPGAPGIAASGLFETVSEQWALYRRNAAARHAHGREHPPLARPRDVRGKPAPPPARPVAIAELMDDALLQRLAPAAILMDIRYRILATRGPVEKYLRISSRTPLTSLLTAAGASLRAATQAACEQALRSRRWIRHDDSWTRRDRRYPGCSISARSLRHRASGERLLLVIFEQGGAAIHAHQSARAGAPGKIARDHRIEATPEASRSNLNAALLALERANDDLEASNEQITAMNEELRSANEELQSSNEEMQAMNEELESSKIILQERTAAAERLEAQLRAVLDATVDAVITLDADGKIVTFNGSASRMFGYALHEVIGRNVSLLLPPELRPLQEEYLARYRKKSQRRVPGSSREVTAYRRDGTRFPALLSVSETAGADLLVGCLRDLTADKALQEEILHIAALEQQRIGQELHDGTQQELTGLGLLAQSLAEELQTSGSARAEQAQRLASGMAEASRRVRSLARGLVPAPVDAATLPAALDELARSTRETYKLSCRLDCPEPLRMPDSVTATHLYRIAQEAVGNAAKHARADDVLIRLANDGNRLRLEVHDNGIGIPARPVINGGLGLRLMEHRCTVMGGRFRVEPRPGGGTVVSCALPFVGRP
ncbi:MAG TPA: chemotaxis protein CheB [Steroidobacteraceae bacterium]|nr:chemotaxis protein CheB [Steroidobacteraceae bacterium]